MTIPVCYHSNSYIHTCNLNTIITSFTHLLHLHICHAHFSLQQQSRYHTETYPTENPTCRELCLELRAIDYLHITPSNKQQYISWSYTTFSIQTTYPIHALWYLQYHLQVHWHQSPSLQFTYAYASYPYTASNHQIQTWWQSSWLPRPLNDHWFTQQMIRTKSVERWYIHTHPLCLMEKRSNNAKNAIATKHWSPSFWLPPTAIQTQPVINDKDQLTRE